MIKFSVLIKKAQSLFSGVQNIIDIKALVSRISNLLASLVKGSSQKDTKPVNADLVGQLHSLNESYKAMLDAIEADPYPVFLASKPSETSHHLRFVQAKADFALAQPAMLKRRQALLQQQAVDAQDSSGITLN